MLAPSRIPPRLVAQLGYGGLLPFLALAALAWLDPARQARWSGALLDYGAVILAFVGALHWALAMQAATLAQARRAQAYAWSVVPALIAWGALQLAPGPAALLLVAGFLLHLVADHALAARLPLPLWYLPLRARLTAVASACLVALAWSGVG
ncbi:MAG: DUF3429 domain-containing protein [Thermomonas haemolytica]